MRPGGTTDRYWSAATILTPIALATTVPTKLTVERAMATVGATIGASRVFAGGVDADPADEEAAS
jgi:hypothetical protein